MGFFNNMTPSCCCPGARHSNQYDAWLARERLQQNRRLEDKLDAVRQENVQLRAQVQQSSAILQSYQNPEDIHDAMDAAIAATRAPSFSHSLRELEPGRRLAQNESAQRQPSLEAPRAAPQAVPPQVRAHASRQGSQSERGPTRPKDRDPVDLPPKLRALLDAMPEGSVSGRRSARGSLPHVPAQRPVARPEPITVDLPQARVRVEPKPVRMAPAPDLFTFPKPATTRYRPEPAPRAAPEPRAAAPHYTRSTSPFARAQSAAIPKTATSGSD